MFFLSSYDHFQRKLIIIAKSQGFFPWLFSLSWEQRKVGEILEERDEQAPKSSEYPLMAFIANEGVAPKGDRYDRSALVNDTENKPYKKTEYGDFIYSSNNLETGSIGLNTYGKASISPVYSIFHPTDLADSDFIGRRLVRKDFINEMVKWRQGVIYGQWRIHESDFIKIEIPIPSLAEQKRIGAFFKSLDNLITLHQHEPLFLVMLFSGGSCVFKSAWEQRKLSDYLTTSPEKNISGLYTKEDVLSVSGDVGIVNQIEFQGRSFAGASVLNYGIVETGDVVYTKSPLRSNPYGIIKANKGKPGIVSTLYAIYHPSPLADPDFIQCYFEQDARVNSYLHPLVNKGAKNDMKVSADNALKGIVHFPSVKEQQTISAFFKSLDDLITLHQREHKSNFRRKTNVKQSTRDRPFLLLLCSVDKGLQRGSGP